MSTIYTAIAVLGMTAILGMYLLSFIFREKETPKGVAMIHGLFAVIGLVLVIVYSFGNTPSPTVSLIIFIIAAMGGLVLIYKDITGQKVPKWLGLVHGVTAVIGFSLLIGFACCQ